MIAVPDDPHQADDPYQVAQLAADALAERTGVDRHDALVVLGSGWAGAATALGEIVVEFDVRDLPGFVAPVAQGHPGRLLSTRLPGHVASDDDDAGALRVLVVLGRTHLYEGHGPAPVVHAVRTAAAAGCRAALLTNASGALRQDWPPGTGVVLRDHIDLGSAGALVGPRFIDLTDAYAPRLRDLAHAADPELAEGVYAILRGPHFETVAEARMLRTVGADLVGMSTVPEVIAARDLGLEVLGLSVVASVEPLEYGAPGVDADEVLRVAAAAATRLRPVLATVLTEGLIEPKEAHHGD
ncbi:MAG: purine-nucleoside phosphorylase [Kineosporiaceae bacterium]